MVVSSSAALRPVSLSRLFTAPQAKKKATKVTASTTRSGISSMMCTITLSDDGRVGRSFSTSGLSMATGS